jgi:integrase
MPLSDAALRNLKPTDKTYKRADGQGLYVLVKPDGGRYWRLKYRYAGREGVLALGVYPEVGAAEARARRDEAKRLLRDGIDPATKRREEKAKRRSDAENTFEAVAREWISKQAKWTPDHAARVSRSLEQNLFPYIGSRPIAEIKPPEVLEQLRRIEARGSHEIAHRVAQRAGAVFSYGIQTHRCEYNPATALSGALASQSVTHYSALTAKELPAFLDALDAYQGEWLTKLAIRLLMLTFVRTAELRGARWDEIDFEAAEWRIPAERMKMREPHVVPLSHEALAVLREVQAISGGGALLFPSRSKASVPFSENTILFALYRMGYKGRMTGHGFRAMASTILNEMGHRPDVIERQLAHVERNKVRAAYNRAQYLAERRLLMEAWANFVATARAGNVVPPNQAAAS